MALFRTNVRPDCTARGAPVASLQCSSCICVVSAHVFGALRYCSGTPRPPLVVLCIGVVSEVQEAHQGPYCNAIRGLGALQQVHEWPHCICNGMDKVFGLGALRLVHEGPHCCALCSAAGAPGASLQSSVCICGLRARELVHGGLMTMLDTFWGLSALQVVHHWSSVQCVGVIGGLIAVFCADFGP